jgi:GntR family transcriptional regulator/MocR family aminotransferase
MARWEFAFDVDRSHGVSVVRQIARAVAAEIQRGRLRPGDRLPGSRTLARTLRVRRQTVVAAFDDLVAEGWLVSKRTSGTFVASLPETIPQQHCSTVFDDDVDRVDADRLHTRGSDVHISVTMNL